MRARNRLAIGAVLAAALVGQLAAPASAVVDGTGGTAVVTATITTGVVGYRTVSVTNPLTITSALGADTLSGSLNATVAEAARSGTAAWSLTATMTDLTNVAEDTIAKANMAASARAVTPTAGGGTSSVALGSSPLSGTVTLFSNAGQLPATVYTGTYASASTWTLGIPNGSKVGVYSGLVTLTLVQ